MLSDDTELSRLSDDIDLSRLAYDIKLSRLSYHIELSYHNYVVWLAVKVNERIYLFCRHFSKRTTFCRQFFLP